MKAFLPKVAASEVFLLLSVDRLMSHLLPNELDVKDRIREIVEEDDEPINIAIKLCLYCMKTQIFLDGNKRASVIFATHYLISHGGGFLVIPEKEVPKFKQLLVKYYEGEDIAVIAAFMKERCWKTIES